MARFEDLQLPFWDTSSDYGVQPPLTDRAVVEAERLLNVTLPDSLLDLLRNQNGGQVSDSRNAFPTSLPTSWSADHVPFDSVMGIGHRERTLSMLDSPYLVEEWGLPTAVVLVSGNGHYWIGLDYRTCGRHGEPSVAWFDADDNSELALAPDFHSFIKELTSAREFKSERNEGAPG
ncbi:SMI1/KNR4 family protein [Streptomyces chiangmaiensis]|uniref:SMI1/KNR4 family protein n=1 Tax=Streptomyces chiangmaiensis TaxID=766497 RepID=A0ABU7FSR3_9ACTN|nr:SMI1/KNR4 family protein [Streptomyces chiangmaiensis]MED7827127.1 SMI1/KNR4 family protein [Streptomyces chiangmaiensis]